MVLVSGWMLPLTIFFFNLCTIGAVLLPIDCNGVDVRGKKIGANGFKVDLLVTTEATVRWGLHRCWLSIFENSAVVLIDFCKVVLRGR